MINRTVLMKVHVMIAVFILPVTVMFVVTGVLYTWGIKGQYEILPQKIRLESPLQKKLSHLVEIVEKEFNKQQIPLPTGAVKIKAMGNSFQLEWTGSKMDVILEPTSVELIAQLKIKKTTWHRHFVQLHKAKGGLLFKVYASILAIGLLLLLITGFIMAWQLPKLRKITLTSTILGFMFFIVMFISS